MCVPDAMVEHAAVTEAEPFAHSSDQIAKSRVVLVFTRSVISLSV